MEITLYNVIDTRTGRFHSEVTVDEKKEKFFVPAGPQNETEEKK